MAENQLPQQNIFYFDHINNNGQTSKIRFNSIFDSGNLKQVFCPSQSNFIIHTAPDCCGTEYEGTSKSWYYFGVKGAPKGTTFNFTIKRISILYQIFKSGPDAYRPVYKVGEEGPWKRIEEKALVVEDPADKTIDVKFSFTFNETEEDEIFFAFSYPFSYQENKRLLEKYDATFQEDSDIYYYRELFIKTPQERDIDLVTITSQEGKQAENESFINDNLFPLRDDKQRARKFRLNKPVILITARVHPGETPASHTMNGILEFLLDKKDIRAQLLRNYFTFMLIPMINPDGVANGHYRMDIYNQNLNRYYKNPDLKKQPAIYAIKELVEHLNSENRLFFYCDLHAHAAKKGCFLYGNALDFVMQVESILFARILSLNCISFEYESSNFSKKHMSAKDKGEKLSKEGSGRVCVHKIGNLIHSYTLECGLHFSNQLSRIIMPSSNKEWYEDEVSDINSPMYKDSPTYYSIKTYENLGKGILVSILDTFDKNPCTRLLSSNSTALEDLRREVAARVIKIPRFWKEANVKKKCLKINEIVKEMFYDEFHKRSVFSHIYSLGNKTQLTARRIQHALTQLPATAKTTRKQRLYQSIKTTTVQASTVLEWEEDENVENENAEQEILPKLKTSVPPKEFRIKNAETKISLIEKLQQREESSLAFLDKKTLLQQSLKGPEKGILSLSEYSNLQENQTPSKSITLSKEGTQVYIQQILTETTIKNFKKTPASKDYVGKIIKSSDKKRITPLVKLPELDQTATVNEVQSSANPSFVILGNRNYLISKRNVKESMSSSVKKSK